MCIYSAKPLTIYGWPKVGLQFEYTKTEFLRVLLFIDCWVSHMNDSEPTFACTPTLLPYDRFGTFSQKKESRGHKKIGLWL